MWRRWEVSHKFMNHWLGINKGQSVAHKLDTETRWLAKVETVKGTDGEIERRVEYF